MRRKINGFTLIELLSVIVILAMLALVVYPNITAQLRSARNKLSTATVTLIESGARSYLNDHRNEYPKVENARYCITLDDLAKENYIRAAIVDSKTNEEIDLTQVVVAKYKNKKYTFEIKDACS